jgi:hypothetical protein
MRTMGDVVIKRSCLPGPLEDWPEAICRVDRFLACYHVVR